MTKKVALLFAVTALAVAGEKSYSVRLPQAIEWGSTPLKAGEYTLKVVDQKAVMQAGKVSAEVPVKTEEGAQKYNNTMMQITSEGGKAKVKEICIGGTRTKLLFND